MAQESGAPARELASTVALVFHVAHRAVRVREVARVSHER
jgi:hypothetical protein